VEASVAKPRILASIATDSCHGGSQNRWAAEGHRTPVSKQGGSTMKNPVRFLSRLALVGMALTGLLTGSTAWAEKEDPNLNKLKVGMVLTLEGVDAAGVLYIGASVPIGAR
jgi:hypothetical protein